MTSIKDPTCIKLTVGGLIKELLRLQEDYPYSEDWEIDRISERTDLVHGGWSITFKGHHVFSPKFCQLEGEGLSTQCRIDPWEGVSI